MLLRWGESGETENSLLVSYDHRWGWGSGLVLFGIEFLYFFFIVARVVLCFGFVLETALITHRYFSYCWVVLTLPQSLSCSSDCPTSEWAEGAQEAGGAHSGDSWPQLDKGTSCTLWCDAQQWKLRKKEEGGSSELLHLSFQVSWWSPAFLGMAEHLLASGK